MIYGGVKNVANANLVSVRECLHSGELIELRHARKQTPVFIWVRNLYFLLTYGSIEHYNVSRFYVRKIRIKKFAKMKQRINCYMDGEVPSTDN